jgi:pimeloyl-ACP methyl ester carboxylesterase
MGGLIGMLLAAQPGAPIRRLVMNDVGPVITAESLRRIGQYVGNAPRFPSFPDAVAYVRNVSAPFGPLSDAQWQALTEHCVRQGDDGLWGMVYDPGIGTPFRNAFVHVDVDLWGFYEALRLPVLAIRGAESDLLAPETHQAMAVRGPRAQLAEVPGVGHAPMFTDAGQIRLVTDFLLQESP